VAYDKNKNYQEEINKAVSAGDYASASRLEQERNEKIVGENLSYATTNNYTKLNGEDDATYNKRMSSFNQSDESKSRDKAVDDAYANFNEVVSKDNIVSQGVKNTINSQFQMPSAVTEADSYLREQLQKIQSGKTSYSDQLREMMDKIMNREKFSYDVDTDPLFQQALASAMNSGKQAMQDTIGQASALTGGYGSTYATTAGNQAYNSFIEDAYDNLPQYYEMAMNAYQMEGDELYRQYGMLSTEDDKEYNRNIMAYDATYQQRNQMYNEAYGQFRDSKSDAFAMADLQLAEHGQKVSDAYNLYNASTNYAESLYAREYKTWADEVNQAMQIASMKNTDWWNQKNFDESVRQYEKNFAEQQRQHNEQMAYKWASLNKKGSGSGSGGGGYELSTAEVNGMLKASKDAGGGEKGIAAAINYLKAIGKAPTTTEQADIVYNALGIGNEGYADTKSGIDWKNATITKKTDTWNGIFNMAGLWGNIDSNDVYTVNGTDYYVADIRKAMEEDGLPAATIEKIIKGIDQLGENGTYKYNK
jgi:hypothetical protein